MDDWAKDGLLIETGNKGGKSDFRSLDRNFRLVLSVDMKNRWNCQVDNLKYGTESHVLEGGNRRIWALSME